MMEARTAIAESEAQSGTLTLSAPETLCTYRLPPLLRRFRDIFPGVNVHLRSDMVATLSHSLNEGVAEIALIMAEPLLLTRCHVEALAEEPLLLLTYPGHPLAGRAAVSFCDLQDEPLLLTEAGCGYRRVFEQAAASAGVRFANPMEFHSVEAIKQCVIAGLGLTLLPAFAVAGELAQGRLVSLPLSDHDLSISIQMVWHREKWLSPALATFLALVREDFLVPSS
jgi:DNA-binding transcriptional LysR family regulator